MNYYGKYLTLTRKKTLIAIVHCFKVKRICLVGSSYVQSSVSIRILASINCGVEIFWEDWIAILGLDAVGLTPTGISCLAIKATGRLLACGNDVTLIITR